MDGYGQCRVAPAVQADHMKQQRVARIQWSSKGLCSKLEFSQNAIFSILFSKFDQFLFIFHVCFRLNFFYRYF